MSSCGVEAAAAWRQGRPFMPYMTTWLRYSAIDRVYPEMSCPGVAVLAAPGQPLDILFSPYHEQVTSENCLYDRTMSFEK